MEAVVASVDSHEIDSLGKFLIIINLLFLLLSCRSIIVSCLFQRKLLKANGASALTGVIKFGENVTDALVEVIKEALWVLGLPLLLDLAFERILHLLLDFLLHLVVNALDGEWERRRVEGVELVDLQSAVEVQANFGIVTTGFEDHGQLQRDQAPCLLKLEFIALALLELFKVSLSLLILDYFRGL